MRWTSTFTIDAPATDAWRVSTDIGGLPDVTPTIAAAELLDDGPLRVGSRARLTQPGQRPAIWTVTALEEGRAFTWRSARPGLALLGTHRVEPAGDASTCTLELAFDGPLARLLAPLLGRRVEDALAREGAGIKAAAERAAGGGRAEP